MYTYTWKKYLPVIRILLKRSVNESQQLSLNRTDFEKTNKIRKPVCSFSIEVIGGRLHAANQSAPAKNLLEVLMQDEVTRSLLRQNNYSISLNSDFQLSIKNNTPPVEPTAESGEEQGNENKAGDEDEVEQPVADSETK